jgi:hypothetical protein
MCDVLLPPGVNPTAVKYIYHINTRLGVIPSTPLSNIEETNRISKDLRAITDKINYSLFFYNCCY